MSNSTPASITFERTDIVPPYIESACKDIADYYSKKENQTSKNISNICRIIKQSKRWDKENLKKELDTWYKLAVRTTSKECVDLVYAAYDSCRTTKDIHKLRGYLVEALTIAAYGGSKVLGTDGYGWGALVKIQKEELTTEVKYVCADKKAEECKNRSTVDFGYWNGNFGSFYECKANPIRIGCKEIKYMVELGESLNEEKVDHKLFFMCPETADSVRIRLKKLGIDEQFVPIGYDNLFSHKTSSDS
ncbi:MULTISPECIES: hypothetical protein [Bacillus cereus group]|uniref:hypothetical protein n=1 Tax=Bacillus cereus group TaxID=86661 RepID=UPI000BF43F1C|nr:MULTISPECIES: hypothetical protein [Bacillus cereus group]MDX6045520.1 hypothetical protein [Bacillus paranthracis]PFL36332.1 hypothetical protein COJ06_17870 [Bacillus cereus]PGQ68223.1 hypothetical protein COA27_23385 [Bacillus cereus]